MFVFFIELYVMWLFSKTFSKIPRQSFFKKKYHIKVTLLLKIETKKKN